MQTRKKCVRCNTLNDADQMYCTNCGKYLLGKTARREQTVTVWGMDDSPAIDRSADTGPKHTPAAADRYVAVCPACGTENETQKDLLPLACAACGYFFQAGIDRPVKASADAAQNKPKPAAQNTPSGRQNAAADRNDGPLPRTRKDTSTMRLIAISSQSVLPETMREAGNIIGKNGTAFRSLQTDQQLSIWHTPAGWYARATMGEPLFNGIPMTQGVQVRLSSGDLLILDQEQFMTEIL